LKNVVKQKGCSLEQRLASGKNHGFGAFFNLLNVEQGNMFSGQERLAPASR